MTPMPPDIAKAGRALRPLTIGLLALALAACASSRGLAPQDRPHDPASLHAEQTLGQSRPEPGRLAGQRLVEGVRRRPARCPNRRRPAQQPEPGRGRCPPALGAGPRPARPMPRASQACRCRPATPACSCPNRWWATRWAATTPAAPRCVLDFSYGVDLWGGKRAAWEAAVDQVHAAEVDAQAARLNLSAAITETYTELAYAWRLLDVANDELARAEDPRPDPPAPQRRHRQRPAIAPGRSAVPTATQARTVGAAADRRSPQCARRVGRAGPAIAACRSSARTCRSAAGAIAERVAERTAWPPPGRGRRALARGSGRQGRAFGQDQVLPQLQHHRARRRGCRAMSATC